MHNHGPLASGDFVMRFRTAARHSATMWADLVLFVGFDSPCYLEMCSITLTHIRLCAHFTY